MCMAAASRTWNSGRFVSMQANVSPRLRPSDARPAAITRTFSAYSAQVRVTPSPIVRRAVTPGRSAAEIWKASQTVPAFRASVAAPVAPDLVTVIAFSSGCVLASFRRGPYAQVRCVAQPVYRASRYSRARRAGETPATNSQRITNQEKTVRGTPSARQRRALVTAGPARQAVRPRFSRRRTKS